MKKVYKRIVIFFIAFTMAVSFTNCEATKNANNKQKGATIGATCFHLNKFILMI